MIDTSIVVFLNRLALTNALTKGISIFLASGLIWIEVAIVFFYCYRTKHFKAFFLVGVTLALVFVLNHGIGKVWFRPRPFAAYPTTVTQLIAKSPTEKSFPSDHAVLAGVLAVAAFVLFPAQAGWFVVGAILIGIGRILAGVHYPTDILAGLIIGVIVASGVFKYFRIT